MSDKVASEKLEGDEQNPADNITEEEPAVRVPLKGKKKGKGKKRRESVESRDEDDGEVSISRIKKKGKKKSPPKERVSSDVQPEVEAVRDDKQLEASVTVDKEPQETVIEIQGGEEQPDELEEVVVKKESAVIEAENIVLGEEDSGEGSGEEKKDEKKDRPTVRRRATLSDLRSESIDKVDGEQATSTTEGSEVLENFLQLYFEVSYM